MSPAAVLTSVLARNVQLWVEDGDLCLRAPKGALTPELRARLTEHKTALMALLGDRRKHAPLSFAQQRLWLIDRLEPNTTVYNMQVVFRLQGALDAEALERSLDEIMRRHDTLRTSFTSSDGQPIQVVAPHDTTPLPRLDLGHLPEDEALAQMRAHAIEIAETPFDLSQGPLFRTALVRLKDHDHVLVLATHHIVSDGWSIQVLTREVFALYAAFSAGRPSPLAPMPAQYADVACRQRQWLDEHVDGHLAYWERQLGGKLPILELTTDRPRPAAQTFRGDKRSLTLPVDLAQAVKTVVRQDGATLFMGLLAAFQTLLHRYTGASDVIVGLPIAGRDHEDTVNLIGFFANTLALRVDLADDPCFREALRRVRAVTLDAQEHDALPFEKLVEAIQPHRDPGHSPVFQVTFALQNVPRPSLELPDLTVSRLPLGIGRAKFDLSVAVAERPDGLRVNAEFNTDLFDGSTIERLLRHYRTLLEGIAANPEAHLSELPIMQEAERRQLLDEWNATQRPYPRDATVHGQFEAQAAQMPDAAAVRYGEETLTYGELNVRANQLAHHLRALGLDTGQGPTAAGQGAAAPCLCGLFAESGIEMVVAVLAILKAGAAYVPLDPVYPKKRLAHMLEDAALPVVITQGGLADWLPASEARVVCVDAERDAIAARSVENLADSAGATSLAYVMYTSGSTGVPKAVCVTHRNIVRLICNTDYIALGPGDRMVQVSNTSFDALTFELWDALLTGAQIVGIPKEEALSPRTLAARLRRDDITVMFLTTSLFNQVALEAPDAFATLRYLIFGGETADPRCVRTVLENSSPEHLINVYGPTENTVFSTWYEVTDVPASATTVPIGIPVANSRIYLLDGAMQPVPVGVPAEVYCGGDGVAQGYLNRAELTAQRSLPDPFSDDPDARLYKTGDLARYLPDGNIEFVGRMDHQVKLRGFRIELGEIESALAEHPDVREAVVLAREDTPGEKRLVAYIVPRSQSKLLKGRLKSALSNRLPGYMVPSAYMVLDAFPLTPNRKVDRRALPAPDRTGMEHGERLIMARDPLELQLAHIWESTLNLDAVGVTDDFFDLGGHSLMAVHIMDEVERQFGNRLPASTLFSAPTIEQLAALVRDGARVGLASPIVPIQPRGNKPPFYCVHPSPGTVFVYFDLARHLDKEQPLYGLQAPAVSGHGEPYANLEAMVASYVEAIRTVQPEGPYYLGGFSSGAVVAFAMARQLEREGQEVGLVVSLASPAPMFGERAGAFIRAVADVHEEGHWLKGLLGLAELFYDTKIAVSLDELRRLTPEQQLEHVLAHMKDLGLVPPDATTGTIAGFVKECKFTWRHVLPYDAEPCAARLALLCTRDPLVFRIEGTPGALARSLAKVFRHEFGAVVKGLPAFVADLLGVALRGAVFRRISKKNAKGWQKLSPYPVSIRQVPGNHVTALTEPHVRGMARALQACLDEARGLAR